MKICEIIDIELLEQQVIFIQGYKTVNSIMKNFEEGTELYDDVKFGVDYKFKDLVNSCNGWVTTVENGGLMLPVIVIPKSIDVGSVKDLSVLVHELTHVVQKIRNKFWTGHDEIEYEATVMAFLFKKILTLLTETKNK